MIITRFFRSPGLSTVEQRTALATARDLGLEIDTLTTEHCFYVASDDALEERLLLVLRWLLAETFEPEGYSDSSFLPTGGGELFEVGPRMSFSTAWSTNAVAVCHACGLTSIQRIERSRRFYLPISSTMNDAQRQAFLTSIHDRMTECPYPEPLSSFKVGVEPRPVTEIPVLEQGRAALDNINSERCHEVAMPNSTVRKRVVLQSLPTQPKGLRCSVDAECVSALNQEKSSIRIERRSYPRKETCIGCHHITTHLRLDDPRTNPKFHLREFKINVQRIDDL